MIIQNIYINTFIKYNYVQVILSVKKRHPYTINTICYRFQNDSVE